MSCIAAGSAVITVNTPDMTDVHLRLEACTLSNNTADFQMLETGAAPPPVVFLDKGGSNVEGTVFSDDLSLPVCTYEGAETRIDATDLVFPDNAHPYRAQPCNVTQVKPLEESVGLDTFLREDDSWFVDLKLVWRTITDCQAAPFCMSDLTPTVTTR